VVNGNLVFSPPLSVYLVLPFSLSFSFSPHLAVPLPNVLLLVCFCFPNKVPFTGNCVFWKRSGRQRAGFLLEPWLQKRKKRGRKRESGVAAGGLGERGSVMSKLVKNKQAVISLSSPRSSTLPFAKKVLTFQALGLSVSA